MPVSLEQSINIRTGIAKWIDVNIALLAQEGEFGSETFSHLRGGITMQFQARALRGAVRSELRQKHMAAIAQAGSQIVEITRDPLLFQQEMEHRSIQTSTAGMPSGKCWDMSW